MLTKYLDLNKNNRGILLTFVTHQKLNLKISDTYVDKDDKKKKNYI